MIDKMTQKNIIISAKQEEFIKTHPNFNFSAWVREMLDDYIRMIGGLKILKDGAKTVG